MEGKWRSRSGLFLQRRAGPPCGRERRRRVLPLAALFFALGVAARADEPYARSRDYDLQNARIELRFDLEQRRVIGEVTHQLVALRDSLAQLEFDSVDLAITSVNVAGKPAKFATTATKLVVTLDHPAARSDKMIVDIRYSGQPKKGLYFVLPDKNYPDRPRQIWTQGEAEDTRYYVPIYDYPNDRTATEMIVTVPANWLTVSNGKLVSVKDDAGGMKTWHWRQSEPHSTYLISLVAGEFDEVRDTWRSIPVTYYVPRGRRDRIPVTFERTKKMLDFFSDALGVAYPWEQYAQVAVDDFVAGGMENTSATTLTDAGLQNPATVREYLVGADDLISHELAHQWFGDLVTCKDWANVWLNEGFASYAESLWEEHQYGAEEAAYGLWRAQNSWMRNQRLFPVPIVTRNFTDSIEYAGNLYTKGSWVLHMLRRQLGDADFFRALKHYLDKYRDQNVVTADFAKAIEESTGKNVDQFFDQWVYHAGAPKFDVRYTYDEAAREVKLQVKQTQKVEGQVGLFRVPVDVEITTPKGKKLFPITISQADETFPLAVDDRPLLVLIDKGDAVLKSVDFDKHWQEWVYQLQHAESVPDRADAARALGEVKNNDEVVAALGEAALRDAFWGVRGEALHALGNLGGPAAEKQILAALSNSDPWVRLAAVEALGAFKEDAAAAERLERVFREDAAYRVRTAALTSLAQEKAKNAFDVLRTAAGMDSPDNRFRAAALRAMGALGDERAVPLLLDWSATGKPFPVRAAAISSLARLDRKNKDVTQRLLTYLEEPYHVIRRATIPALGQRGDPDAVGPLEALIKSNKLEDWLRQLAVEQVEHLKQSSAGVQAAGPAGQQRGPADASASGSPTGGTSTGASRIEQQILQSLEKLERENAELSARLKRIEDRLAEKKQ